MRYIAIPMICLTMSLAFPSAGAAQNIIYTRHALLAAMQSAHTTSDYARLARYFQERSIVYRERSAEQARILREALEHPHVSTKYPATDVSARRFHEYYSEQARQARDFSDKYERLKHQTLEAQGSVKDSN